MDTVMNLTQRKCYFTDDESLITFLSRTEIEMDKKKEKGVILLTICIW